MANNILFVISTEYHLMAAVSIIDKCHMGDNSVILGIQYPQQRRLPQKREISKVFNYTEVICDQSQPKKNLDFIEKLQAIKKTEYKSVYIFNDTKPIEIHLGRYLKQQGAKVVLAPDGLRPYKNNEIGSVLTQLKRHLRNRLFLFRNNLSPYIFSNWTFFYGIAPYIDEVWLTTINGYTGFKEKTVVTFDMLDTVSSRKSMMAIYGEESDKLKRLPAQRTIVYIPNILSSKVHEAEELDILRRICTNSKCPVYIKMHPLTEEEHKNAILSIPGINQLNLRLPAELIISNLESSIVISPWSTALIINNKSCKFYWLSNIILTSDSKNMLAVSNPTEHILVLNSKKELESEILEF